MRISTKKPSLFIFFFFFFVPCFSLTKSFKEYPPSAITEVNSLVQSPSSGTFRSDNPLKSSETSVGRILDPGFSFKFSLPFFKDHLKVAFSTGPIFLVGLTIGLVFLGLSSIGFIPFFATFGYFIFGYLFDFINPKNPLPSFLKGLNHGKRPGPMSPMSPWEDFARFDLSNYERNVAEGEKALESLRNSFGHHNHGHGSSSSSSSTGSKFAENDIYNLKGFSNNEHNQAYDQVSDFISTLPGSVLSNMDSIVSSYIGESSDAKEVKVKPKGKEKKNSSASSSSSLSVEDPEKVEEFFKDLELKI